MINNKEDKCIEKKGYFTIYLTEAGDLYGVGSNRLGLLGQPYTECFFDSSYAKVTKPVLLMQNVLYASAGRDSILALKNDGTVWWWGEYKTTYLTKANKYDIGDYWKSEEDDENPVKILYNSPKMILEDCIYAVTGDFHGAAITSSGELYTWGLNIFGECGVKIGEDDFVRVPTKVLDNVKMVWIERIDGRGSEQGIYDTCVMSTSYYYNVFVHLNDGTLLAAGEDLGSNKKTIEVTGDIIKSSTETYSDSFLPISVEEYSDEYCRKILNELQWGDSMSQMIEILSQSDMEYSEVVGPVEGNEDELTEILINVNDYSYMLYLDDDKCLCQIDMQVGGSRDGSFMLGMTLEEVKKIAECELVYEQDMYRTAEPIEGTYYSFTFDDDGSLIMVTESVDSL